MTGWRQPSPYGDITVVTSDRGLQGISFGGDAHGKPQPAIARQLDRWFAGKLRAFDVELDLEHVEGFRRRVLETLAREVAWGETVSYGELAGMAGRPRAARAAGTAMATNPIPFVIPCHRVIAAGNRIGGYGFGVEVKRELLAREGVSIRR